MDSQQSVNLRNVKDGKWFWVPNAVITQYASKIGAISISVYNLLASMADGCQKCFPSQQYIAEILGYSRPTICKALKRLEQHRLIAKEKRSQYRCIYSLLHVRCNSEETQMSNRRNSEVPQVDTNKTQLTRIFTKTVVSVNNPKRQTSQLNDFKPQTKNELLAFDISETVGEPDINKFLPYAERYDEVHVREILSKVRQTRDIKKSRTALFFYLLKNHAKRGA